jgi:N-acetylmuramoyl-L-alanine amidase
VLMTRTSDVFVPLGERVRIARTSGAALFVSVHADTLAGEPGVSGATVYTASDKASDAEAARVAESENQADLVAGLDSSEEQSEVSDILFDLTRRETRAFSHVFARTLVGYWKEIGRLNKNPQRSAGFRVLKAPDVPSVLLELGYLSSEKDLTGLVAPAWRQKAAGTVAKAIDRFFQSRGGKDQAEGNATGTNLGLRPGNVGGDGENVAASIH